MAEMVGSENDSREETMWRRSAIPRSNNSLEKQLFTQNSSLNKFLRNVK